MLKQLTGFEGPDHYRSLRLHLKKQQLVKNKKALTARLKTNTVEKSSFVISFFLINAPPNPPSVKTVDTIMKNIMIPTCPNSKGESLRANTMLATREMIMAPICPNNDHKIPERIFL
jgi:hypothetical protein